MMSSLADLTHSHSCNSSLNANSPKPILCLRPQAHKSVCSIYALKFTTTDNVSEYVSNYPPFYRFLHHSLLVTLLKE